MGHEFSVSGVALVVVCVLLTTTVLLLVAMSHGGQACNVDFSCEGEM